MGIDHLDIYSQPPRFKPSEKGNNPDCLAPNYFDKFIIQNSAKRSLKKPRREILKTLH